MGEVDDWLWFEAGGAVLQLPVDWDVWPLYAVRPEPVVVGAHDGRSAAADVLGGFFKGGTPVPPGTYRLLVRATGTSGPPELVTGVCEAGGRPYVLGDRYARLPVHHPEGGERG